MPAYPIELELAGRLCVVIGGGHVGQRKLRGLLAAGARIRVIDPVPAAVPAGVELVERPYRSGDLDGAALAFAATSDRQVNAQVAADARRAGIPVNVADAPEEGTFAVPALLRRGDLTVAVGSAGRSPALAALLRDRIDAQLGPEWALLLEIAAALRQKRLTLLPTNAYNHEVLRRLLTAGLPGLIAAGDGAAVDHLLAREVGAGVTLAALGVRLPKGRP